MCAHYIWRCPGCKVDVGNRILETFTPCHGTAQSDPEQHPEHQVTHRDQPLPKHAWHRWSCATNSCSFNREQAAREQAIRRIKNLQVQRAMEAQKQPSIYPDPEPYGMNGNGVPLWCDIAVKHLDETGYLPAPGTERGLLDAAMPVGVKDGGGFVQSDVNSQSAQGQRASVQSDVNGQSAQGQRASGSGQARTRHRQARK